MDYRLEKCKLCSRKFRIDIINELESTRVPFIFHIRYDEKSKFKSKGNLILGRHNKSAYLCIDCVMQVNDAMIKYFSNKRLDLWKFEKEVSNNGSKKNI